MTTNEVKLDNRHCIRVHITVPEKSKKMTSIQHLIAQYTYLFSFQMIDIFCLVTILLCFMEHTLVTNTIEKFPVGNTGKCNLTFIFTIPIYPRLQAITSKSTSFIHGLLLIIIDFSALEAIKT